jgi:hypothetical protein
MLNGMTNVKYKTRSQHCRTGRLFAPFDVSRILETWKFPVRFLHGECLERLKRSEAVERLQRLEPSSKLRRTLIFEPPQGVERSKAVERLERLELPSFARERPFHAEKTRSKPLDRAIYTIFYRLINTLRWSDRWEADCVSVKGDRLLFCLISSFHSARVGPVDAWYFQVQTDLRSSSASLVLQNSLCIGR